MSYLHQNRHSSIDQDDEEKFYPPLRWDTSNLEREEERGAEREREKKNIPTLIISNYLQDSLILKLYMSPILVINEIME